MPNEKTDISQVVVISMGVNWGQDDAYTSVDLQSFLACIGGISSVFDE